MSINAPRAVRPTSPIAATLVLGVALCVTACTSRTADEMPAPRVHVAPTASYLGQLWVLTAVDHGGEHVIVPKGSKAYIEFDPSGRFSMSDTANGAGGRFSTTLTGFRVSEAATTLVGVATEGPKAVAARAMQGVLGRGDLEPAATEIPARVVGGNLILNVGSDVLSFERCSAD